MTDEDRPKRSRFDQTEPSKKSRFDRRSRSPHRAKDSEVRSSVPSRPSPSTSDAASAAAAAAAKINAQIQAKKEIQHVDVPPIKASTAPIAKSASPNTVSDSSKLKSDMYIADGDYIKDIEVNDLRNRYTLTKGSTQKMIKDETGADVTTRGSYYPDKSMATASNPPLYLHITSQTKEGLDKAIAKIEELMRQELPNLIDERRFRRRDQDNVERDEHGRRKWPDAKIPIDLEPLPGFNIRAQVVGQQGAYVKHIQNETGCKVQIKGQGSGFPNPATGQEHEEPMYLHVTSSDAAMVEKAKSLCEDLLTNVRQQWQRHKDNPPPRNDRHGSHGGYGGYGGGYGSSYGNSYGSNNNSGGYGGYGSGYGSGSPVNSAQGTTVAPGTAGSASSAGQQDYSAQWAAYFQQNPQMALYYQAQQQYQQSQAVAGAPGAPSGAGAPGAPGDDLPPPPPPPLN